LGIVTNTKPDEDGYKKISLGPASSEYFLYPRAELTACERVVENYIRIATSAALQWPERDGSFMKFAQSVSLLMIACHSVQVEGVGLTGGKAAEIYMKRRTATPMTGRRGRTRLTEKTDDKAPYTVPHIVRQFILAADLLKVFDYNCLLYKDIEEYVPDVTKQAGKVGNLTLARIKDELGLDPFYLSCHLCFAHQIPQEDLQVVLDLPYRDLDEPLKKWYKDLQTKVKSVDSHPPNLHSLLKALVNNAKGNDIEEDQVPGGEGAASTPSKKRRKVKKNANN